MALRKSNSLLPISPGGRSSDLITVDRKTGEIVAGVPVIITPKRRHIAEPYAIFFLASLQAAAMDRTLGLQDHRVLLYMLSQLELKNELTSLRQVEMARDLQMQRQHVNRSLKRLLAKRVLVRESGSSRRRNHYKFNPFFVWRGAAAMLKDAQQGQPSLCLAPEPSALETR